MPGGVYFGLESSVWTGGVAMYDPGLRDEAAGRAYLISEGQLADIVAQEMHREPGTDIEIIDEVVGRGRLELGDGRYETLVHVGDHTARPMITFTAPWRACDVSPTPPAAPYLAMLASGLSESHRWDAEQITAYLVKRPGVAGAWNAVDLQDLVRASL